MKQQLVELCRIMICQWQLKGITWPLVNVQRELLSQFVTPHGQTNPVCTVSYPNGKPEKDRPKWPKASGRYREGAFKICHGLELTDRWDEVHAHAVLGSEIGTEALFQINGQLANAIIVFGGSCLIGINGFYQFVETRDVRAPLCSPDRVWTGSQDCVEPNMIIETNLIYKTVISRRNRTFKARNRDLSGAEARSGNQAARI